MKWMLSVLLVVSALPAVAGIIRHDVPDSMYTGFGNIAEFQSVGLVDIDRGDSQGFCSGTAIHKNWVLTAAHCLTSAQRMGLVINSSDDSGWRFYEADSWVAHENYNEADFTAGWDIGLMYFETDLDVDLASLYRGNTEVFNYAYDVGFGYTGDGYTGIQGADFQRRAGSNIVDFAWSQQGDGQQLLWSDFDHPTDASYNRFAIDGVDFDDLATFLEIMIAFGDSGGGTFVQENGQLYLAGVHSFITDFNGDGAFGYGDAYASTRVGSLVDWIDQKINPVAVPEPGMLWLSLLAFISLAARRIPTRVSET
jgi:hypothetical protein